MKFDKFRISQRIKDNLGKMGFVRTTDIQFKTIPAIMNREDVLAIAQTGSGKTAAFAIPIIDQIHSQKMKKRSHGIKCLVLAPTRELAQQIDRVFVQLSANTKVHSTVIYGGVEQDSQIESLNKGVDVLVATPGRMFDLIYQEYIDVSSVKTLVLDEADHMLDLGFIEDIESIKRKLKQHHQTLFFSATINPQIKKLAYSQVKSNALRIQVSPEDLVSKNVTHYIVKVEMDEKRHLLLNFFKENPEAKTLVFVRTQVRAERVKAFLSKNEMDVPTLHGGLDQGEREKNLENFRKQDQGVLIATDVNARGIDLPGVTHVINYDLPDDPENYVHRVGRTGRGFAKGEAVSFCSSEEKEKLFLIEDFIQTELAEMKVDKLFLKEVQPIDITKMGIAEMLAHEEAFFESPKKKKKKRKK